MSVVEQNIDFVLANPSFYVELEALYKINRIATLKNRLDNIEVSRFGSVIFARTDNNDIHTLKDVTDRKFAAVKNSSLDGFLMAWRVLLKKELVDEDFMNQAEFLGTHDQVVYAVLNGQAEVGIVRTDTLSLPKRLMR